DPGMAILSRPGIAVQLSAVVRAQVFRGRRYTCRFRCRRPYPYGSHRPFARIPRDKPALNSCLAPPDNNREDRNHSDLSEPRITPPRTDFALSTLGCNPLPSGPSGKLPEPWQLSALFSSE